MSDTDTDTDGGDTEFEDDEIDDENVDSSQHFLSKQNTLISRENKELSVSTSLPLVMRASSRLMTMKQEGKLHSLQEMTSEFEYNAGDILTVIGEEDDFYVCRVLEDVPLKADSFLVAWYDRIGPNVYEVIELSNSYYMIIPEENFHFEESVCSESDVEYKLQYLTELTSLAFVSKLLLAAQYRCTAVNPYDYSYRALGTHIELMDCTTDECQLILKHIHNTSEENMLNKYHIEAIYRVSRPNEQRCMTSCGVHSNHHLLWHGIKTENVLGILHHGLRRPHRESPMAAEKGIYFSNTVEASLKHTSLDEYPQTDDGFTMLCQVALRKEKNVQRLGDFVPDPTYNVTMPYGAILPTGPLSTNLDLRKKENKRRSGCSKNRYDSTFVVYKKAQIQQRYLVQFKKE